MGTIIRVEICDEAYAGLNNYQNVIHSGDKFTQKIAIDRILSAGLNPEFAELVDSYHDAREGKSRTKRSRT